MWGRRWAEGEEGEEREDLLLNPNIICHLTTSSLVKEKPDWCSRRLIHDHLWVHLIIDTVKLHKVRVMDLTREVAEKKGTDLYSGVRKCLKFEMIPLIDRLEYWSPKRRQRSFSGRRVGLTHAHPTNTWELSPVIAFTPSTRRKLDGTKRHRTNEGDESSCPSRTRTGGHMCSWDAFTDVDTCNYVKR